MEMILKSQKHVFWQALILTVFFFSVGVLIGFLIESNRTKDILETYQQLEVDMLDIKIQSELFSLGDLNCQNAVEENVEFADRVYHEAKKLDRYGDSSRFTKGILLQHKKYDLLRTLLWLNSMKIKEKCNSDFNILVYFYDYDEPELEINSRQKVFSGILGELKERHGSDIILIPIAGDLELSSVRMMIEKYDVSVLPTILINEEIKIEDVNNIEDIEEHLR